MLKVLVTDAHQESALAVARSLHRNGFSVSLAGNRMFSPGFYSRYTAEKVACPSPAKETAKFVEFMLRQVQRIQYDALFAIGDETCDALVPHLDEFAPFVRVTAPPPAVYGQARDKGQTVKLATRMGLPTPTTCFVDDFSQLDELSQSLSFPVAIKPRIGTGSRGFVIVRSRRTFTEMYLKIHRDYPNPLVQDYIPNGTGYGVQVLMDGQGRPRATFVSQYLRKTYIEYGPSTLNRSVHYPDLVEKAVALLTAMQWTGFAEVEFMLDPRDGVPKVLEVNPRIDANINLPIVCGVDFPYLMYKLLRGEEIEPVAQYPDGVLNRRLIPGDLLHFMLNPDRFKLDPPFFSFGHTYLDMIRADDPLPAVMLFPYYTVRASKRGVRKNLRRSLQGRAVPAH